MNIHGTIEGEQRKRSIQRGIRREEIGSRTFGFFSGPATLPRGRSVPLGRTTIDHGGSRWILIAGENFTYAPGTIIATQMRSRNSGQDGSLMGTPWIPRVLIADSFSGFFRGLYFHCALLFMWHGEKRADTPFEQFFGANIFNASR